MSETYVDALLNGQATIGDFGKYVALWHEKEFPDGAAPSIQEYLGLTWEEYSFVALDESRLRYVAAARRYGKSLEEFEQRDGQLALAARAGNSVELSDLVKHLVDQGVLD